MQKKLILFLVLLLFGCKFLPKSEGKMNQVMVFVSPEDKILVEPIIDELFSDVIHTPQSEKIFTYRWVNPWELDEYKLRTNLLVISLQHPIDSTGDRLFHRFTKASSADHHTIAKTDIFANGQLFLGLSGYDAIDFEIQTKANKEWIINQLKTNYDANLSEYVFSKKKNPKLSQLIDERFGFTIELQRDFKLIKDDNLHQFLWIGRGVPYRWLIFHKLSDDFSTSEKSWNAVEKIFAKTLPDIEISQEFRSHEDIEIADEVVKMIRGLYTHDESQTGGPFFTMIIPEENSNNTILLSGFVNNPGQPKMQLIKQLEVIAKTFSFN